MKNFIAEFLLKILHLFPRNIYDFLVNIFFLYFPIKLIFLFESTCCGYLKYFWPQKGNVIVDAGACEGNFSILASRLVGKNGLVISIEPDPEIFNNILKKRIQKLKINNIILVKEGLWNKNEKKKAFLNHPGEMSIHYKWKNCNKKDLISLVTLDSLVKKMKISHVDFIKMDIEGAEIEALAGAKKTIKKNLPKMTIASYHFVKGKKTFLSVEKILQTYNYSKIFTSNADHLVTYAFK